MNKAIIEKRVELVLKQYGMVETPVSIESIIEKIGIVVSYAASEIYSGMLVYKSDKTVVMGLNSSESLTRKRFTMAHELGHYFLKHQKQVYIDKKAGVNFRENHPNAEGYDPKESEANFFAACLLMPKGSVKSDFYKIVSVKKIFIDEHLAELANKYGVSKEAMKIRLLNLNLITI